MERSHEGVPAAETNPMNIVSHSATKTRKLAKNTRNRLMTLLLVRWM
jgi:hypothetical protein